MSVRRVVPDLHVSDVAAAAAVYQRVLGLDVVMDHGWIATLATQDGASQVSLISHDATAPCPPALSVQVDDLDAAFAAVLELGLEVVHPVTDEEWGVRRFFFRDRDGNVVNVLTHVQPPS